MWNVTRLPIHLVFNALGLYTVYWPGFLYFSMIHCPHTLIITLGETCDIIQANFINKHVRGRKKCCTTCCIVYKTKQDRKLKIAVSALNCHLHVNKQVLGLWAQMERQCWKVLPNCLRTFLPCALLSCHWRMPMGSLWMRSFLCSWFLGKYAVSWDLKEEKKTIQTLN